MVKLDQNPGYFCPSSVFFPLATHIFRVLLKTFTFHSLTKFWLMWFCILVIYCWTANVESCYDCQLLGCSGPLEDKESVFLKFLNYFIVVPLQLSTFSPHPSTPPQPNPTPSPASTLPFGFVLVSFVVVPENPSPHCPFPPPLWLLLDCS